MQECPCCKKDFSDGVASCPKCFIPLMPKPETCPCPECGEEIPITATRCFRCGSGLECGPEEAQDGPEVEWEEVPRDEGAAAPVPGAAPSRPVPATHVPRRAPGAKKGPGGVFVFWIILIVLIQVVRALLGD